MNKDFLVFLVPLGIFLAYWIFGNKPARPERIASRSRNVKPLKEQRNQKISAINLLFKHASKEFKEYKVVNKNGKILVCELAGARNELRELVFISINPLAEKSIQKTVPILWQSIAQYLAVQKCAGILLQYYTRIFI